MLGLRLPTTQGSVTLVQTPDLKSRKYLELPVRLKEVRVECFYGVDRLVEGTVVIH